MKEATNLGHQKDMQFQSVTAGMEFGQTDQDGDKCLIVPDALQSYFLITLK